MPEDALRKSFDMETLRHLDDKDRAEWQEHVRLEAEVVADSCQKDGTENYANARIVALTHKFDKKYFLTSTERS
eukprot:1384853-Amphidinium_carterae.1